MKTILKTMALLLAATAVSQAGTYYVATGGSDSNPGTQSQPFQTVSHAAGVVSAGDTVIVENGTYNETIVENASGTSSAPITIQAQNQWGAVIAPSGSGEIISVNGSYVTIENFEIIGNSGGTNNDGIKFQYPGTGGHAIGNKIHNIGTGNCTGGAPIITAQTSSVINANFLYDYGFSGCNQYEGIYINDGNGQTVTNNLIGNGIGGNGAATIGIQINGQEAQTATFPSNETVTNNTLFNLSGWGTLWACWSTPSAHNCSNNKFNNNILYTTGTNGISGSVRTANNGGTFDSTNSWSNNLIFNSGSPSMDAVSLTNTITSDPLFVNYQANGSGNYQLQTSSPAIGAGTSTGAPSTDFAGNQRTPPIWAGAYQSGSSTSSSAPNPPTGLAATVN